MSDTKCNSRIGINFSIIFILLFVLLFINNKIIFAEESMNEEEVIEMLPYPTQIDIQKINEKRVKLSWERVEQAYSYQIYRSTKPKKGYKKIKETAKIHYVDKTVQHGKTYYYKIATVKKNEKRVIGDKSKAFPIYMKPEAPTVTGYYLKNKNRIMWNKVTGATNYTIYKKKKGHYKKLGETNKLYFYDAKVKKGKKYFYKVVASYTKKDKEIRSEASIYCKIFSVPIDPNKKMVALTFDDGPGRYTSEIVSCLKAHNAKATFFVVGCNIDHYKSALYQAHKIGCEIGNHSYDHSHFTKLTESQVRNQITSTDKKIKKITKEDVLYVRTPGGLVNDMVKQTVGKPIILWSIDTRDWETRDKNKTIRSVMENVEDGDIVLMHDIYEPTKEAAFYLIDQLQKEGYQLVTVSELAMYRKHQLKKGEIYRSLRK